METPQILMKETNWHSQKATKTLSSQLKENWTKTPHSHAITYGQKSTQNWQVMVSKINDALPILGHFRPSTMSQACSPKTWEVKVGGLQVQGQLWLNKEIMPPTTKVSGLCTTACNSSSRGSDISGLKGTAHMHIQTQKHTENVKNKSLKSKKQQWKGLGT